MSHSGVRDRVDVVTILAMLIASFLWFSVAFDAATGMVARAAQDQVQAPTARTVSADAAVVMTRSAEAGCGVSGDLVGNGDPAEIYAALCR